MEAVGRGRTRMAAGLLCETCQLRIVLPDGDRLRLQLALLRVQAWSAGHAAAAVELRQLRGIVQLVTLVRSCACAVWSWVMRRRPSAAPSI